MEKVYISPSEALRELNKGNTVYGDTSDGYMKTGKKSYGVYQIDVFADGKTQTFNGTIQNTLKTFNSEPFKNGLYTKKI